MRNTCQVAHNWYNGLKRHKLTWEKFLSKWWWLTMKSQGGTLPNVKTSLKGCVVLPRALIKILVRSRTVGCLHVLRNSERNWRWQRKSTRRGLGKSFVCKVERKGIFVKECKVKLSGNLGKDRQKSLTELSPADSNKISFDNSTLWVQDIFCLNVW